MPNWLRALIAGYGAKKLGGGCFTTILVFVVIYFVLGQCNHPVVRHASIQLISNTNSAKINTAFMPYYLPSSISKGKTGENAYV